MLHSITHHPIQDSTLSLPLLSPPTSSANSSERRSTSSSDDITDYNDQTPLTFRYDDVQHPTLKTIPSLSSSSLSSYKPLAVLSSHVGSVSSLALCGEFILSASQGRDIIVWQLPDLRQFTKFGQGDGSVKAVTAAGSRVFTAHQDGKIRAWKVSRSSENVFKIIDTLPTKRDYLGKFMNQSNYVQTRRHHKVLWIEHADSISCLAVSNGMIYSGSWDKTIKVWRVSDFKCLESIKAHDDAINGLIASNGIVYSASADGKIKAWGKTKNSNSKTHLLKGILEGHKDVSLNSVVVSENGRYVYGGGSDGYVIGWLGNEGLDSWKTVCEVRAHKMAVLCMCVMGDEFLCSGSADRSISVWRRDVVSGGLFRHMVIGGHNGPVKCLQASPVRVGGGFMLYSGSLDKSLRVWWVPGYNLNGGEDEGNDNKSSVEIKEKGLEVYRSKC